MQPLRTYCAPLDGLRAVAILGVILFHFSGGWFSGGFVGVDIFFVISGYIITRNILNDRLDGVFSLSQFFKKRFLRLFPALLVVILASVLVSVLYVSELRAALFAQVGLYAATSVSNIYFFLNSGYFEDTSKTNVLLHTWSLSVEEQFYLIWPFACAALFMVRQRCLAVVAVIFGVATVGSFLLYLHSPSAMFYLMPARIFQFVAGALIATAHLKFGDDLQQSRWSSPGLATAGFGQGMVMIAVSFLLADGENYRFALAALLPTIGAALIILFIQSGPSRLSLGLPVITAIGQRAYALYLVHWPVSVLLVYQLGTTRDLQFYAIGAMAVLVLAEALHRFVERPFRSRSKGQAGSDTPRVIGAVGVMVLTLMLLAHVWLWGSRSQPEPDRSLEAAQVELETDNAAAAALALTSERYRNAAHRAGLYWVEWNSQEENGFECYLPNNSEVEDFAWDACFQGASQSSTIVFGDSTGREALLALHTALGSTDIGMISGAGCLPVAPTGVRSFTSRCEAFNEGRRARLEGGGYSTIVLAGNWRRISAREMETTIDYYLSLGLEVVVFGLRPVFFESVPTLLDSPDGPRYAGDLSRFIDWDSRDFVTSLQERYAGNDRVTLLDSRPILCRDEACSAFSEAGDLLYLDRVHLSLDAARWLGERHADEIQAVVER